MYSVKDWMTSPFPFLIKENSMPVKAGVGVEDNLVCMNALCIYLSIFNCSLNSVHFTFFSIHLLKKKASSAHYKEDCDTKIK